MRVKFRKVKPTIDFKHEIEMAMQRVKDFESALFEGIEPFALQVLMKMDGKTKGVLKTTLTLKGVNFEKDYRIVKVDECEIEDELKSDIDTDSEEEP